MVTSTAPKAINLLIELSYTRNFFLSLRVCIAERSLLAFNYIVRINLN